MTVDCNIINEIIGDADGQNEFLFQVTEETCRILEHFGYEFEQRGLVAVKGKGQLMTYYLLGKRGDGAERRQTSPSPRQSPPSNNLLQQDLEDERPADDGARLLP